jgi:(R,R)-butanediol dehydrogenase/meso-butanediol dehydrogenase/diacetyl reductase
MDGRDIRVDSEVLIPEIKPDQVLVNIEWCGICGSDLHEYVTSNLLCTASVEWPEITCSQGPSVIPTEGNPHPLTGEHLPVIMGHDFGGKIGKVGKGSKLKLGLPVTADPRLYCKSCHRCNSGQTNICTKWAFRGLHGQGGGFSEVVAVDEDMCYALPES